MILSTKHDYAQISLHFFIYPGNVFVNMSTKKIKLMKQTQIELNSTQTTPILAPILMKEQI